MELTRTTTAVVLDSTSDFVDARERHENMRIVPLYVLFDGEPLRDQVDIGPGQFYERLAAASSLPTTSQPTPADFLACYQELVEAGYTRIWSLHLTSKLSGTHESAVTAAKELGGDVVRVVDTQTASLACGLLAEADRPAARAGDDGRGARAARRALPPGERRRLHGRDARVPAEGRPHREGAGARGLAAQREADPLGRGRRDRPGRPRARASRRR